MSQTPSSNEVPLEHGKWKSIKAPRADRTALPKTVINLLGHVLKDEDDVVTARYPYGDLIVDRGTFQWPDTKDDAILRKVKKEFAGDIPLCVVVGGSAEVYDLDEESLQVIRKGKMFGVYEALDRVFEVAPSETGYYSISSGCRSVHIVHSLRIKKLDDKLQKQFNLKRVTWTTEKPHHELVKALMNAASWRCEIIALSKNMVKKSMDNADFARDLFKLGWHQTAHTRALIATDDTLRQKCNDKAGLVNYRLVQYLTNALKGNRPCYRFTHQMEKDSGGPFAEFQMGLYKLCRDANKKQFSFPFLVQAEQLDPGDQGYYSLSRGFPTLTPPKIGTKIEGSTPSVQCNELRKLLIDDPSFGSLKYFSNGKRQKDNPVGPGGHAHHQIDFQSVIRMHGSQEAAFQEMIDGASKNVMHTLDKKQLHLTTGFLNAGVVITR